MTRISLVILFAGLAFSMVMPVSTGFFTFLSLRLSAASPDHVLPPQVLSADNPIICTPPKHGYDPYGHTDYYSFNVQSGIYTVVALLNLDTDVLDPDPMYFYLYSDEDYTQEVSTTALQPKIQKKATWRSLGFFIIDGSNLENEKPYYAGVCAVWGQLFIIEMENGKNSSMKILEGNNSVTGSFTDIEIIDAYQVYFESGFTYNITLDVPANISYDLFLSKGTRNEKAALASSHSEEHGIDESINSLIVNETGNYCIVITNPNCYQGSYTLDITGVEYVSETASFSTLAAIILPLALATVVVYRKRRYYDH